MISSNQDNVSSLADMFAVTSAEKKHMKIIYQHFQLADVTFPSER